MGELAAELGLRGKVDADALLAGVGVHHTGPCKEAVFHNGHTGGIRVKVPEEADGREEGKEHALQQYSGGSAVCASQLPVIIFRHSE